MTVRQVEGGPVAKPRTVGKLRALGGLVAAARLRLRERRWQAALAAVALMVVSVSGALRSEPGPVVPGIVVPPLARYSVCPGGPAIGDVRVGDDVLLTGRSEDGTWLEMQAPRAPQLRVWVPARLIDVGEGSLPVRECRARSGEVALETGADDGRDDTMDTTRSAASVSTEVGASSPTTDPETSAGDSTSTTAAPNPDTTTTAPPGPDRMGPFLTQLRAGGELPDGPDRIFGREACGPTSIPVEALVLDPSGLRSVSLHWSFPGQDGRVRGSVPMVRADGKHRATFGPLPARAAPATGSILITWWVEATDTQGNVARAYAPRGAQGDERIRLASCA